MTKNSQKPQQIFYKKSFSREIPDPKLIVLYNGKEDYPAEKILTINSLYKKKDVKEKIVDLKVKVLNINRDCNPELEYRSKALTAYSVCIAMIREYEKICPLNEAIKLAVKYCIKNDLLKEYFKQNLSEVEDMLTTEFDLDEAIAVNRLEAFEKGQEEIQNYILDLIEQGLSREEIKKRIEEMSKNNGRADNDKI